MAKAAIGSNTVASKIFEVTQNPFLVEHVHVATLFRERHEPPTLEFVFTYEENLTEHVNISPPLGKSDHAVLN